MITHFVATRKKSVVTLCFADYLSLIKSSGIGSD